MKNSSPRAPLHLPPRIARAVVAGLAPALALAWGGAWGCSGDPEPPAPRADAGSDARAPDPVRDATVPTDARADGALRDGEALDASDAALDALVDAAPSDAGDAAPLGDGGAVDFVSGVVVSTLVGSGAAGGADGTGDAGQLDNPTGIALDALGQIWVAEFDGARVRRVSPSGAIVTVTSQPRFVGVFSVAVASTGQVIAQTDFDTAGVKHLDSGTLWRVVPSTDGGTTTASLLADGMGRPRGLTPVADGGLVVADRLRNVLYLVDTATGARSLLAGAGGDGGFAEGTGAAAAFNAPHGGVAMADGSVLIADTFNHRIRRVTAAGEVTTYAGSGAEGMRDGARLTAQFAHPRDLARDAAGNVYVTDVGNHRIRRITPLGAVQTIAGDGTAGFMDGAGAAARFEGQEALDVLPDGSILYVADGNGGAGGPYHRIRKITIP